MTLIENLGYEKEAVMMGHPLSSVQRTGGRNTPRLEYDFYSFSSGSVDVYTYMLPTFPLSADRPFAHETSSTETKYGVAIDEGPVMNPTTSSFEYAQAWYENVLKNCAVKKTTLHIDRPGRHTVKIIRRSGRRSPEDRPRLRRHETLLRRTSPNRSHPINNKTNKTR